MTNTNKIISAIVIVAVLVIGVGYAAISNITLNITGTAAATPNDANFKVAFIGTPEVSNTDIVTSATVKDDTTKAEFTIENVSAKGDNATITYTVRNNSSDLSATISATTSNDNTEYFSVEYKFAGDKDTVTLAAGEETTITVTVSVIKTPIDAVKSANVGVALTAQPVQPQ